MTATSKRITQTAVLCIGLFAVNLAWSDDCPEDVRAKNDTDLEVTQAKHLSVWELYELFHAPDLNQADSLGDYVHNFHPDRSLRR